MIRCLKKKRRNNIQSTIAKEKKDIKPERDSKRKIRQKVNAGEKKMAG